MSCELLHCALTRLNIDFASEPDSATPSRGEVLTLNFHVDMGEHTTQKRQFRLALTAKFSEHTDSKPLGFQVETTIVGFFKVSDDVEEIKVTSQAHIHGVNTLYGTLRGIILTASGCFPTGPMVLASRTPQQILGIEKPAVVPASSHAESRGRKRRFPVEEGVKSARGVLAKVPEKADPKAKRR